MQHYCGMIEPDTPSNFLARENYSTYPETYSRKGYVYAPPKISSRHTSGDGDPGTRYPPSSFSNRRLASHSHSLFRCWYNAEVAFASTLPSVPPAPHPPSPIYSDFFTLPHNHSFWTSAMSPSTVISPSLLSPQEGAQLMPLSISPRTLDGSSVNLLTPPWFSEHEWTLFCWESGSIPSTAFHGGSGKKSVKSDYRLRTSKVCLTFIYLAQVVEVVIGRGGAFRFVSEAAKKTAGAWSLLGGRCRKALWVCFLVVFSACRIKYSCAPKWPLASSQRSHPKRIGCYMLFVLYFLISSFRCLVYFVKRNNGCCQAAITWSK